MTDFETIARAEDRSFAQQVQELIDEHEAPIFDGVRWTCRPVSSKGEEQ